MGSMAKFNFTTRLESGTDGLNSAILIETLHFILNFLLLVDFSSDLLDTISDTLLSLICSEQKHYGTLVQEIISQQTDLTLRERLTVAFTELMTKNSISASIDRKNIENFRNNVQDFVLKVKSYLLRK